MTPSLERSRRRRLKPATPSPCSVCTILQDKWCRVVVLSVSSLNEPKSHVFPPNGFVCGWYCVWGGVGRGLVFGVVVVVFGGGGMGGSVMVGVGFVGTRLGVCWWWRWMLWAVWVVGWLVGGVPVDPPSPDYVPGPEHPALPICYVPDSDPEEDPEEDSEEEHADYPTDGGDGDDEPFGDDTDADDDDEGPFEDEEEEEHLDPANLTGLYMLLTLFPRRGFSEAARKTVRPEPPMSASMEARIAEHAAALTPPLPVAPSPVPLPSPLTTSPTDAGALLGFRAAGIQMRAAAASPPSLLPPTSPRTDVPEAEMPPRKRACLTTPAPGYEIGESSAAGAARQPGPTPAIDTWDEIVEAMMEIAPTTLEGVDQRVTELDTTVRQRTEEFEIRFEEAHDDRAYLGALVNTLYRDRPHHRRTALAMDREAVYARIAWTSSEERSAAIEAHVRTLEAQVATLITQTTSLQTRLTSALGRIATLEARDPEPQDGPAEAGSSS
ncbi:hypothetical protein Tco_1387013 [Tanacetum coccineum]